MVTSIIYTINSTVIFELMIRDMAKLNKCKILKYFIKLNVSTIPGRRSASDYLGKMTPHPSECSFSMSGYIISLMLDHYAVNVKS